MWSQVGLRKHHYEQSRMEFQQSYFKSWKMMLRKGCTQYASKFGKLSSGHRTGKGQFSFQSQKKGNAKECSNFSTIALILHASKVMLKILQVRLQQYVNSELSDVQAGFRKGRGIRDQIANICWIIEKQENSRKTSSSLTMIKPLTGSQQTGKFLKRWEYQTTLPASWETCMQVKKQQLKLDKVEWLNNNKERRILIIIFQIRWWILLTWNK